MTARKLNIGILFGGKSAEHEISLQSAKNILEALDKEKYNPILIAIDKTGRWITHSDANLLLSKPSELRNLVDNSSQDVALVPQSNGKLSNLNQSEQFPILDVVFPILHGPFGEDGTVQGLLKLANIPFVGASVLGSAVGMDKDVMKRLLRDAGIPIGNYTCVYAEDEFPTFEWIQRELGLPCFIKPANLGSSVGISKVNTEEEYLSGLKMAFQFDTKVLIEEFIKAREIECGVLGNHNPIASIPGEIIAQHNFYSYEAKYLDDKGALIEIPANLSEEMILKVQKLAIKTFQVLCCEGLGRVDVFLTEDNRLLVNEINTLPGFTKISMYPKMWEYSGIPYSLLIDKLIDLAIDRFQKEQKLKTSF
ncbi:MAG: D-alanine--D-alanine ligase [Saprospiraceae bacterium]|nr:D-alanine--D-alanine ligase [Saprospiraceae bacterium]